MESTEPETPPSVSRSSPLYTNKSSAGLGLMVSVFFLILSLFGNFHPNSIYWGPTDFRGPPYSVHCIPSVSFRFANAHFQSKVLLCALPSLLSVPTQPNVPARFSLPLSDQSLSYLDTYSSFDFNSLISGDQHDWSMSNAMDLDFDPSNDHPQSLPISAAINGGKLEFGDQSLDISFDAISSEDGKIRVRIHPSASASGSPRSLSPLPSTPGSLSPVPNYIKSEQEDPFLGVGGFDFGSDLSLDQDMSGARKRIRIALRNMPGEGNEGGEWEVEVC